MQSMVEQGAVLAENEDQTFIVGFIGGEPCGERLGRDKLGVGRQKADRAVTGNLGRRSLKGVSRRADRSSSIGIRRVAGAEGRRRLRAHQKIAASLRANRRERRSVQWMSEAVSASRQGLRSAPETGRRSPRKIMARAFRGCQIDQTPGGDWIPGRQPASTSLSRQFRSSRAVDQEFLKELAQNRCAQASSLRR